MDRPDITIAVDWDIKQQNKTSSGAKRTRTVLQKQAEANLYPVTKCKIFIFRIGPVIGPTNTADQYENT